MGTPYIWDGPEEPLWRAGGVVATGLKIISFTSSDDGFRAEGTIDGKDYIEGGISFTDPWEAHRPPLATAIAHMRSTDWIVRRKQDDSFFADSKTGEMLFTCNGEINRAIKTLIAWHIVEYFKLAGNTVGTNTLKEIRIKPEEYKGRCRQHSGDCVCVLLQASNQKEAFDCEGLTGEDFPRNCFHCSCGRRWWCYEPAQHLWAPVSDDAAWNMFMRYNGVEKKKVGFHPDGNGFYLLQTLRDQGLIPIG